MNAGRDPRREDEEETVALLREAEENWKSVTLADVQAYVNATGAKHPLMAETKELSAYLRALAIDAYVHARRKA